MMNTLAPQPNIPEKFIDPQSGEVRLDSLLSSYLELERKMSERPSRPASPDEYQVDVSHGLFDIDPDVNKKLYEYGFTLEQVQAVYDMAAEKLVPMILEMSAEFQADRENERLIAHFGGEDKWQEISRQLLAYGRKNLPPEVLNSLSSSFEGIMALHRMMQGQEPGLVSEGETGVNAGEEELRSMMRDPRYWRERDPGYVAKVTEGFRRMYGAGK
ncbi:MAG: hypothetical protein H6868_04720 [Rhodospirillales bacterium]|nr:hypothetical protein [Rhodospirillales bacterium]